MIWYALQWRIMIDVYTFMDAKIHTKQVIQVISPNLEQLRFVLVFQTSYSEATPFSNKT